MVEKIVRAAEWLLVMEGIYGSETQTDKGKQTEEERPRTRDMPAMRDNLPQHEARTRSGLPARVTRDNGTQESDRKAVD